jgi:hypothetical protein
MLRDNLRLTRMHALLVCGMLARLPLLLWRKRLLLRGKLLRARP